MSADGGKYEVRTALLRLFYATNKGLITLAELFPAAEEEIKGMKDALVNFTCALDEKMEEEL